MAIASLILGIVSIVIPFLAGTYAWVGAIVGLIGIILAALARKQGAKGPATAGLVCSIIGVVLSVALYLACAACVKTVQTAIETAATAVATVAP